MLHQCICVVGRWNSTQCFEIRNFVIFLWHAYRSKRKVCVEAELCMYECVLCYVSQGTTQVEILCDEFNLWEKKKDPNVRCWFKGDLGGVQ